MPAIAFYILKVLICSGLLFGYYLVALKNKRFHTYNRFYLLSAVVLSWIIPLLQFTYWDTANQQPQIIKLLTVVSGGYSYAENSGDMSQFSLDWYTLAITVFCLVSAVFLVKLLVTVHRIVMLVRSSTKEVLNEVRFIFSDARGTPFSFFNYIFWNNQIDINTDAGKTILQHELVHVYDRHSADKLFINIILIGGWFNPFFFLIRKELNMLHEFIADQKACGGGDASAFALMILNASYAHHSGTLTQSFFHSPIKRRLLMLTSSKHPRYSYLRRVMVLPLVFIVFVFFAFRLKSGTNVPNDQLDSVYTFEGKEVYNDGDFVDTTKTKKQGDTSLKPLPKPTVSRKQTTQQEQDKKVAAATGVGTDSLKEVTVIGYKAGVEIKKPYYYYNKKFMTEEEFKDLNITTDKIATVSVYKGPTALEKFGEKGHHGVIEITTKVNVSLDGEVTVSEVKLDKVFTRVENPPYYQNGMMAFAHYIETNMQYPKQAVENKIEGAVSIQFIIDENGKLSNFKKLSSKGYGLEEEAIRLLKNSGDWKPAVQNGRKVSFQAQQEIIFVLPGRQTP